MRAAYPADGGPPTLELSFSANPFFSNTTMRRCLGEAGGGAGSSSAGSEGGGGGVPEVTTDIAWKDNAHKLTVRVRSCSCGGGGGVCLCVGGCVPRG